MKRKFSIIVLMEGICTSHLFRDVLQRLQNRFDGLDERQCSNSRCRLSNYL